MKLWLNTIFYMTASGTLYGSLLSGGFWCIVIIFMLLPNGIQAIGFGLFGIIFYAAIGGLLGAFLGFGSGFLIALAIVVTEKFNPDSNHIRVIIDLVSGIFTTLSVVLISISFGHPYFFTILAGMIATIASVFAGDKFADTYLEDKQLQKGKKKKRPDPYHYEFSGDVQ